MDNQLDNQDEASGAPQNWSMVVIMLAIVAALGFGGTAMMYRRAEASKRQAEAALAMAQAERERAEVAFKEARAQQRLAEQFREQVEQMGSSEAEGRERAGAADPKAGDAKPETAKPEATAALLREALSPVDPQTFPTDQSDMRAVLDAAAKELESGRLKDKPLAAGAVHSTLGHTYLSLGENAKAAEHLRKAVALRGPVLGAQHADVVRDQRALDRATAG